MTKCPGLTPDGDACKAHVKSGDEWCRWHNPAESARDRHREASKRGGLTKAHGALAAITPLESQILDLDLTTATGLSRYMAATLQRLAMLPFDTRVDHAIAGVMNAQRGTIELAEVERRLLVLEKETARLVS